MRLRVRHARPSIRISTVIALEESRTGGTPAPANDDSEEGLMAAIASSLNPMKLFS